MHKAEKFECVFSVRIFGTKKNFFGLFTTMVLPLFFFFFFGQVPAGQPQIFGEEGRFEVGMVRELSYVVSKVNWSRVEPVWSRLDTLLGRVLADFCHFWPFLAIFGPFLAKNR